MLDVYNWPTSNGRKIFIMLEETGLPYRAHPVSIRKGEQFAPEFLKFSPNNKIPAVIDQDGPDGKPISLFESGAILMYLAQKSGMFLPKDMRGQYEVLPWLFMQVGHVGPMFGQAHHFHGNAPEGSDYAIQRFDNEQKRIYNVLDKRLGESEYLGGDYSIADIAVFPWTQADEEKGMLKDYPNVKRWFDAIMARPGVQRGLTIMADVRRNQPAMTPEVREIMFGAKQYEKR
ncbi:MAG TPA: glutathione S-transferase N-terminal domain-containing protein [Alphaproteobacteria bacterium]|nr:glutathione S-transferase N-terminal domain-containing protein [Alphaproteobacteria bacterium]